MDEKLKTLDEFGKWLKGQADSYEDGNIDIHNILLFVRRQLEVNRTALIEGIESERIRELNMIIETMEECYQALEKGESANHKVLIDEHIANGVILTKLCMMVGVSDYSELKPAIEAKIQKPLRFYISRNVIHGRFSREEYTANLMDSTGKHVLQVFGVYHTRGFAIGDCKKKAEHLGMLYEILED